MNTLRKLLNSPLFAHGFAFVVLFAIPTVAFGAISDGKADFLPLTTLPGVTEAANSVNLSAFLNSIYGICVGAAAVLAVLQIVRGGVTYMLGDSVTEKREARHHIALAVFGLVLVLSPAIVFGIIDPRILNLNVDVTGLKSTGGTPTQPSPQAPVNNGTSCDAVTPGATITEAQFQCCSQITGHGTCSATAAFGKNTCTCTE